MQDDRLKPSIDLPPPATRPVERRPEPDYDCPDPSDDGIGRNGAMRPSDVRRHAPYRPGEVVWVYYGHELRRAAIEAIGTIYLETHLHHVPKYKARLLNKDGKRWSGRWRYIYPGQIIRGYHMSY